MAKSVRPLLPLQEKDLRIREVTRALESKPKQIESINQRIKTLESDVENYKKSFVDIKKQENERQIEIKEKDAEIGKLRQQILSSKKMKNEEYQMILKQISVFEAQKGLVEDRLVELYYKIDEIDKARKSQEEQLKSFKDKSQQEIRVITEDIERLSGAKKALVAERDEIVKAIERDLLLSYEKSASHQRDGVVLSRAVKKSQEEEEADTTFACEACGVVLAVDQVSMLISGEEIVHCKHCFRIVYIETEI